VIGNKFREYCDELDDMSREQMRAMLTFIYGYDEATATAALKASKRRDLLVGEVQP
jgi:hypothetical protein